jgi:hypothetical protein
MRSVASGARLIALEPSLNVLAARAREMNLKGYYTYNAKCVWPHISRQCSCALGARGAPRSLRDATTCLAVA